MPALLRRFVEANRRASEALHRRLPRRWRTDGNAEFRAEVPWRYVRPGDRVIDLGGGKQPFFAPAEKQRLGLEVTGVDLSRAELARAPAGAYDRVLVADAARFRGQGAADLLVCQALLEHVADTEGAVRAIAAALAPGGTACVFVPCRNALYARLNLSLPEGWKRRALHAVYPHTRAAQGFPSFYDRCTPRELSDLFRREGLEIVEERLYFTSRYFFFLVPLYLVWQGWILAAGRLAPRRLCETMTFVVRRPAAGRSSRTSGP